MAAARTRASVSAAHRWWHALVADGCAPPEAATRTAAGALIIDAGIEARAGSRPGGGSPRSAWAGSAGSRSPTAAPRAGRSGSVVRTAAAGARLPRLAVCRLEPEPRGGWRLLLRHGVRARPRPGAVEEALYEELHYADDAGPVVLVLETDRRPPDGLVEPDCRRLPVPPDELTIVLTPTVEPRRHRADHRAGARGGAAQGACAGLSPGPCAGRSRRRPAAAPHRTS